MSDILTTPVDEKKVNSHMEDLLNHVIDSADAAGEDVKEIPHKAPTSGQNPEGPMDGKLMNFTVALESMENIIKFLGESNDYSTGEFDEKEALEELNKLFTPVLVMQDMEKDIQEKSFTELESANVLTERSIIKFDDETRYSQLVDVCAKIIAKMKNTEAWQLYKKAAVLKKQAGLDIQKQEYDAAKVLAQKYLVQVSTSNPSSVARDAASDLLPQTQH